MRRAMIGCVVVNLVVFAVLLFGRVAWLQQWAATVPGRSCILVLLALSFVGSVYFVVDAARRQFDQERELAIALAVTGMISFGITTIPYYLKWGYQPLRDIFNDWFCELCWNSSSAYSGTLDLDTHNYVWGGRLVGRSRECPECGSTIRTHCIYLCGIPVYSAGSFRVQCRNTNQFLLRKCSFYGPHLATILVMPLAIIGFVLWILWID